MKSRTVNSPHVCSEQFNCRMAPIKMGDKTPTFFIWMIRTIPFEGSYRPEGDVWGAFSSLISLTLERLVHLVGLTVQAANSHSKYCGEQRVAVLCITVGTYCELLALLIFGLLRRKKRNTSFYPWRFLITYLTDIISSLNAPTEITEQLSFQLNDNVIPTASYSS